MKQRSIESGCQVLVQVCADLRQDERVVIISDPETLTFGDALKGECVLHTRNVSHITIPALAMHGEEPPQAVASKMLETDVIFGITKMSMAHSKARKDSSLKGARYLSLPDYSAEVFCRAALYADFRGISKLSEKLATQLSNATKIRVMSAAGTDIVCSAVGRIANNAPGWCDGPGTLASPPDAEANVAVLEDRSSGVIVVDGSIPHPKFGVLKTPITLQVIEGRVATISGERSDELAAVFDAANNRATRVVAEFGIGLNPQAKLCGSMLEDEGVLGTVHFGIGSNSTIGGINSAPFHLDHVICNPTVVIDGKMIMKEGKLIDTEFSE